MNDPTDELTAVARRAKWIPPVSVLLMLAGILTALSLIWHAGAGARSKEHCRTNMTNIGLALLRYHEHHGCYPPAYVVDAEGRRLHSWRVLILPELGHKELQRRYRFDEPWDGPHNRQLIPEMPPVFGCPAETSRPRGQTNYVAVVGPTTIWPNEYSATKRNVTDGVDNTFHVVENNDLNITWTEPRDLSFDEVKRRVDAKEPLGVANSHENRGHALFADGHIRLVNPSINGDIFKMLCTIASGLPLPGVDWKLPIEFTQESFTELRPAESFQQTSVEASLETPLKSGRNVIYCGTFQLAWDALRDELATNEVRLDGEPPLVTLLNSQRFPKGALSPNDYLAMAGRIDQGILKKIADARSAKFPTATFPLPQPTALTELLTYCYLQKRLPFEAKFDRMKDPLRFHGSLGEQPVVNFGIQHFKSTEPGDERLRSQIDVLDYVNDNNFVIRLKTLSDHILLAKIPPYDTLAATWESVAKRLKKPQGGITPPPLVPEEPFAMPNLAFFIERDFNELQGRAVTHPAIDLRLAVAKQLIKFQLDESGAKLEAAAEVLFDSGPSGPPRPPDPRRFLMDRPFLLALHERGTETPYLVLWIDNAELMIVAAP